MNPGNIYGATRVLGAPAEWDQSQGECAGLPILDRDTPNGPAMISEWVPTAEERERLVQGLPVHVWVFGHGHPVLAVSVGEVAE